MSDFSTVLLLDDRLKTTDKIRMGVCKGAMNIDQRHQSASSSSASSIQFTVQTPNLTTYIDRRVLFRCTTKLKIVGTPTNGSYLFPYSFGCALGPWPNHQMCSTMTSVINSAATSIEIQDELPALVKLYDDRHLMALNSMCPYYPDRYANYDQALGNVGNPLGGYDNAVDPDLVPRGAFPMQFCLTENGTFEDASVFNWAGTVGDGSTSKTLFIQYTSAEPLMISPWTWLEKDAMGIYGVSTLNFNFTVSPSLLARVVRYAPASFAAAGSPVITFALDPFKNVFLDFQFLTAHSSLLQSSRNVIPYYNLNRQNLLTSALPLGAGDSKLLVGSTITLNNIPDEVIIFARKSLQNQTCTDPDFFLAIESINITFANKNGILANALSWDLFQMTKKNYVSSNYNDWVGYAIKGTAGGANIGGAPSSVATSGSLLALSFGRDIALQQDFEAPSLLGQYQFQINVTVKNQTAQSFNVDLLAVFKSSGICVSEMGVSNLYQGVLTMEQVLEASKQEAYPWSDADRMIGGNIFSNLKSKFLSFLPKIPGIVKEITGKMDNPYAKAINSGLEAFGYGESGGKKLSKRIKA